MNPKYIMSGFVLVIACVLIYRTVLPQVMVDRSIGVFQDFIRFVEDSFGTSSDISNSLEPARSRSDVFLYYFSQMGMIFGIILIVIGIFVENGGKDLFASIKQIVLPPQQVMQEKKVLSEEEDKELGKNQLTIPPIPLGIQELATKCAKGEISAVQLEKMFIEGKIDWKQYSFLKDLCTR